MKGVINMAVRQGGTLGTGSGKIKLSILKQEFADEWFEKTGDTMFITSNYIEFGYHSQFFEKIGTDIRSTLQELSAITTEPLLCTLKNGSLKWKNCGSQDGEYGTGNYWSQKSAQLNYYDTNNTLTPIFEYAVSLLLYFKNTNGFEQFFPVYLCVLIDDDEKRARLISLQYFNVGNHNTPNFSFGAFNLSYTIGDEEFYKLIIESVGEVYTDPWSGAGFSFVGGGDVELDLSTDVIGLPEIPKSIASTGFIQIFIPTFRQVNELSDYLWGDGFMDNLLKLWNDPMDILIGLSQYPFEIPSAGSSIVRAGNVVTNITMNYPESQYVSIDCGTLTVNPFYNAYIDFEPYTTCEIFLPYIGFQQLSMDDIMNKQVRVIYRIDLVTGVCCANILCDDTVLYTFMGTCSLTIPISGQNFQNMVQNIANLVCAGVATGLKEKGDPGATMMNGAVDAIMSMKAGVSRSGSVSSNAGFLGPQKPYLVFSIPRTCLPKNQDKYLGYPSYVTYKLSDLHGLTVIDEIILKECSCTEEEKSEIETLLKGGVIL